MSSARECTRCGTTTRRSTTASSPPTSSSTWNRMRSMRSSRTGGSAALIGLLGKVVGQVDGRLDGFGQAEAMLQDQTRQVAGVDATEEVMARRDRRKGPRVVHEAGRVVEAGGLGGGFAEAPHALGGIEEPPRGAQP